MKLVLLNTPMIAFQKLHTNIKMADVQRWLTKTFNFFRDKFFLPYTIKKLNHRVLEHEKISIWVKFWLPVMSQFSAQHLQFEKRGSEKITFKVLYTFSYPNEGLIPSRCLFFLILSCAYNSTLNTTNWSHHTTYIRSFYQLSH